MTSSDTFTDDFSGPSGAAPNAANWSYDLGSGKWGNGELETYTDVRANSYLDGMGHLVIAARKTAAGYTSARLTTHQKFSQQFGHFEVRLKIDSQPGLWPAFWMLGANVDSAGYPRCGEVDIIEDYGHSMVESSVHGPRADQGIYTAARQLPSDNRWHVYRLDWSADNLVFSRDGIRYLTVFRKDFPSSAWVYDRGARSNGGMYLIINLAVGGKIGSPQPQSWPVLLQADYVRVWK